MEQHQDFRSTANPLHVNNNSNSNSNSTNNNNDSTKAEVETAVDEPARRMKMNNTPKRHLSRRFSDYSITTSEEEGGDNDDYGLPSMECHPDMMERGDFDVDDFDDDVEQDEHDDFEKEEEEEAAPRHHQQHHRNRSDVGTKGSRNDYREEGGSRQQQQGSSSSSSFWKTWRKKRPRRSRNENDDDLSMMPCSGAAATDLRRRSSSNSNRSNSNSDPKLREISAILVGIILLIVSIAAIAGIALKRHSHGPVGAPAVWEAGGDLEDGLSSESEGGGGAMMKDELGDELNDPLLHGNNYNPPIASPTAPTEDSPELIEMPIMDEMKRPEIGMMPAIMRPEYNAPYKPIIPTAKQLRLSSVELLPASTRLNDHEDDDTIENYNNNKEEEEEEISIVPYWGTQNVAIYGNTAVVGAPNNDDYRGFALVYEQSKKTVDTNSGSSNNDNQRSSRQQQWTLRAKLLAPQRETNDEFGSTVAIYDDTIVVGTKRDDDNGENSGAVHVFVRGGITNHHPYDNENDTGNGNPDDETTPSWRHQAKLVAPDGESSDLFGSSVGIYGDTIVVGAGRDDGNGHAAVGSAHVFVRNVANSDTNTGLNHGDMGSGSSGTSSTVWYHDAKLVAPDGNAGDSFGDSVAIHEDTIVIGAHLDDDHGVNSGSAHVFVRSSHDGEEDTGKDTGNTAAWVHQIKGDTGDKDTNGKNGSSQSSSSQRWSHQAKLLPPDGRSFDWFGRSVAVHGDAIVVGAHYDDDRGRDSGATHVFVRSTVSDNSYSYSDGGGGGDDDNDNNHNVWTHRAKLTAGTSDDWFGRSVAIDDRYIVIGASQDDGNDDIFDESGSAYVYLREDVIFRSGGMAHDHAANLAKEGDNSNNAWEGNPRPWLSAATSKHNVVGEGGEEIRTSPRIFGDDEMVVSATTANGGGSGSGVGSGGGFDIHDFYTDDDIFNEGKYPPAAHIFTDDDTTTITSPWIAHHAKLTSPSPQNDQKFGQSVGVHDGRIIVGSYSGQVHVFEG
mmetsp:Transcript_26456/g.55886  ORF Transcript_26456/g.55886 Transcript_26456/m.55886 type:complete len:1003 (-) Transcript_26456:157-3165(-)